MPDRTGEIPDKAPTYPDALALVERYRRLLDGQQLKIHDLTQQLEEHEETHAGAGAIREVLEECRKVISDRIRIIPGSKGWLKIKARLNEFQLVELKAVPHGAIKDDHYRAKPHRLRPPYLYRDADSVAELVDLGLGLELPRLKNGLALPPSTITALTGLSQFEFQSLDTCDCHHMRFEHHVTAEGEWPCVRCECFDFDQLHQRIDRFIAEQRALVAKHGIEHASAEAQATLQLRLAA